jgi:HK97 family phage prohead protease
MSASPRFELRQRDDGSLHLIGHACVTDTPYEVGFYTETVATGSFKRTLGNSDLDCQLLVNHTGLPLARTTSGTLRLSEDDIGLLVDADLDPQDADVQSLARKMRRGDVTEMSFAFRVVDQQWNDDYTRRLIRAVELQKGDVSVVAYGANDATTAHIRARGTLGDELGGQKDIPLEERHRRAEAIGRRATGGGRIGLSRADQEAGCNRCQGAGSVTIPCPTCSGSSRSIRVPNYAARARIQFAALQNRPR